MKLHYNTTDYNEFVNIFIDEDGNEVKVAYDCGVENLRSLDVRTGEWPIYDIDEKFIIKEEA